MLHRAHKIRLDPTKVQATHLARCAGISRFTYNWALATWKEQYTASLLDPLLPKPNEAALRRQLNSVKHEQFPWMLEVTKCSPQQAVKDLGISFKNFFKGTGRYPKFKKKGNRDSFYISNDQFKVDGKRIRVPKLGWVRMKESLRFDGKILSATISREAGGWFVSINMEIPHETPTHEGEALGVDLGLTYLAILSDGTKVPNPNFTKKNAAKLRQLNKELSRRKKGSNNRAKTKVKISKHHYKTKNQRMDYLHKFTSPLMQRSSLLGVEDLNVKGMVKNLHLSKALYSASFGEIIRQIEYKAESTGTTVVKVDRWFPSSKMCSKCGVKNQALTLSVRTWDCAACGAHHDRDINAAINLKNMAVSSTVSACGEGSAGSGLVEPLTKLPSVKQEPNNVVCNYV